MEKLRKGCALE